MFVCLHTRLETAKHLCSYLDKQLGTKNTDRDQSVKEQVVQTQNINPTLPPLSPRKKKPKQRTCKDLTSCLNPNIDPAQESGFHSLTEETKKTYLQRSHSLVSIFARISASNPRVCAPCCSHLRTADPGNIYSAHPPRACGVVVCLGRCWEW